MNEAGTVKATHTPGPWTLKGKFPNQYIMHDRDCIVRDMGGGSVEADSRLIAAAPELLKRLQQAVDALNDFAEHANDPCVEYDDGRCACGLNDAIIDGETAIQKATYGGQS